MLGPMEYNPITITLPIDYNRSITYTHMYAITEAYMYFITVTQFQIKMDKYPTTVMSTL